MKPPIGPTSRLPRFSVRRALATARTVDLLNAAPPRNPTRPLGRGDKDIIAGVEAVLQAQFSDSPR